MMADLIHIAVLQMLFSFLLLVLCECLPLVNTAKHGREIPNETNGFRFLSSQHASFKLEPRIPSYDVSSLINSSKLKKRSSSKSFIDKNISTWKDIVLFLKQTRSPTFKNKLHVAQGTQVRQLNNSNGPVIPSKRGSRVQNKTLVSFRSPRMPNLRSDSLSKSDISRSYPKVPSRISSGDSNSKLLILRNNLYSNSPLSRSDSNRKVRPGSSLDVLDGGRHSLPQNTSLSGSMKLRREKRSFYNRIPNFFYSPPLELDFTYTHVVACMHADRYYCLNGGRCVFVGALDIKTCRCPVGYTGLRCEMIDKNYLLALLTNAIIIS